jgi:hypothetical protein
MSDAVWIASFVLCALYLSAGALKLLRPREVLADSLPWVEDVPARAVQLIGVAEVLGGIGVVLPWLTGIAPVLTPVAASALAVLQVLAVRVHLRRREPRVVPFNLLLLVAALLVAVVRFTAL